VYLWSWCFLCWSKDFLTFHNLCYTYNKAVWYLGQGQMGRNEGITLETIWKCTERVLPGAEVKWTLFPSSVHPHCALTFRRGDAMILRFGQVFFLWLFKQATCYLTASRHLITMERELHACQSLNLKGSDLKAPPLVPHSIGPLLISTHPSCLSLNLVTTGKPSWGPLHFIKSLYYYSTHCNASSVLPSPSLNCEPWKAV
jgi:hypothetical protein